MMSLTTEAKNYTEANHYYKSARDNIELILSQYPSSNLAVNLSSGVTSISSFNLGEFRSLEHSIGQLASAEQNPNSCALIVAKTIDDDIDKARVFANVAGNYAQIGQTEKAIQVLSQAMETANAIEHDFHKAGVLVDISGAYIKSRQADRAGQVLSQAMETAKKIELDSLKAYVLNNISDTYIKLGQHDNASHVLAEELKIVMDYDPLISLGREEKINELYDIAGRYAEVGRKEKAAQILSLALELADKVTAPSPRIHLFSNIAGKYAEAGQKEYASQLLNYALNLSMEGSSDYFTVLSVTEIASKYAQIGQTEKAIQVLSQAMDIINKLDEDSMMINALVDIAGKYIDIAYNEKATLALSRALKIETGGSQVYKVSMLVKIAGLYADAGQKEHADRLLTSTLGNSKTIIDSSDRVGMLFDISKKYAEIGKFSEALEIAKLIEDENRKASALTEIAGNYTTAGQKLNEDGIAHLRDIVQAIHPVGDLWRTDSARI
jgi:tetratricopeptide (TPR) repeat protein